MEHDTWAQILARYKDPLEELRNKILFRMIDHQEDRDTFDSEYYEDLNETLELIVKETQLKIASSLATPEGLESKVHELRLKVELLQSKKSILKRYASTLCRNVREQASIPPSTFTELLFNTKLVYDDRHVGRRRPGFRKGFRESLIQYYGFEPTPEELSNDPGLRGGFLWNFSSGDWEIEDYCKLYHIFPYRTGATAMGAIFGPEATEELLSPQNGLLVPLWMENKLDIGLIVIVPDLPSNATKEEHKEWETTEPKEYKFCITQKSDDGVQKHIPPVNKNNDPRCGLVNYRRRIRLLDLDGKRLLWRNNNRPRACYLYYLYLFNIVRLIHNNRSEGSAKLSLPSEVGKNCWGYSGKYVKQSLIRGLGEEFGHEIELFVEDMEEGKAKQIEQDEFTLETALGMAALVDTYPIERSRRNDYEDHDYDGEYLTDSTESTDSDDSERNYDSERTDSEEDEDENYELS